FAPDQSPRVNPPEVPTARVEPAPRVSPAPSPPTPAESAAAAQTDHNLAEMAQQLEAALRRSPLPEGRPPVTDPLAVPQAKVTPAKPRIEPKFEAKRELKIEPKVETKAEAPVEQKADPKLEASPEPKPEPAAVPDKTLYDNLEQEMASLLGRPSGKT
ncbi:MAG: hypothetical protein ACREQD_08615, partial [Candidatus Binataceae bacterium]